MHRSEILNEVKNYVSKAVSRLDRQRYAQESAYVDAFLGRLDGKIDFGDNNGIIDLQSTVVADRGSGAAEHQFGADFALVFKSNGGALNINKAIIAQAKNGVIEKLSSAENARLTTQCKKMAAVTQHYFVFEAPIKNHGIPGGFNSSKSSIQKNRAWISNERNAETCPSDGCSKRKCIFNPDIR